jgi:hypothetical protein
VIFFASIKSNVNILGLWFFTPLTFSIPFIFWYIYLFTEGVERKNRNYILASLALMLFLIPIHAPSVLFSLPFLLIYCLIHRNYFKQEKIFYTFLILPILGLFFYKYTVPGLTWGMEIPHLAKALTFTKGWGVLEVNNSWLELYSVFGYLLAAVGVWVALNLPLRKKMLVYLLWLPILLLEIIGYRFFGFSFLVPYQRNLYYFIIIMPFFSALGFNFIYHWCHRKIELLSAGVSRKINSWLVNIILTTIAFWAAFVGYYNLPMELDLYRVINDPDYQALQFLASQPKARLLANDFISTAAYPISGQEPVGTIYFYGDRQVNQAFGQAESCSEKNDILQKYSVKYVLVTEPIACGWKIIYNNRDIIYEIK